MSKRRVVITGLGLLTPVGNTVEDSWKNIVAGKSGIAPITAFDASGFSARISGSVKDFDATQYITPKELKKMDTFIHYGLAAGIQALDDSGIEVDRLRDSDRLTLATKPRRCQSGQLAASTSFPSPSSQITNSLRRRPESCGARIRLQCRRGSYRHRYLLVV